MRRPFPTEGWREGPSACTPSPCAKCGRTSRSPHRQLPWYRSKQVYLAGLLAVLLIVGQPIVSIPAGHAAVVDFFGHA